MGKIGLPLAVQFASKGHEVIGVDVNPDDLVTLAGELDGQRKADLSHGNDADLHLEPIIGMSIVMPVRADSMTASATMTVVMPCSRVTMSASLPSTASRNCSCSTRSGSGLEIA